MTYVKTQLGFDPAKKFVIPDKAYEYFAECKIKGVRANEEWNKKFEAYSKAYPDLYKQLIDRMNGTFAPDGWETLLPAKKDLPQGEQPTRKSSGIAVQTLVPKNNTFVAGSADLLESTFVNFDGQVEFQNVNISYSFEIFGLKTDIVHSLLRDWGTTPADKSASVLESLRWWVWVTVSQRITRACSSRE